MRYFAFERAYLQRQENIWSFWGEILVNSLKWGLILTLWPRQTECNQACHIRHHQAVLRHCPPSISAVLGTERTPRPADTPHTCRLFSSVHTCGALERLLPLPDVNLSGPPKAADSDGLTRLVVKIWLSKELLDTLTARPLHTSQASSESWQLKVFCFSYRAA